VRRFRSRDARLHLKSDAAPDGRCHAWAGARFLTGDASNEHTYAYEVMPEGEPVRTTLNIDDNLLEQAAAMTGVKEKTTLVKLGLEALIARESARRLARLGGSEKQLAGVPRRRGV
jgi:Arc/MetJ family transcription regulator